MRFFKNGIEFRKWLLLDLFSISWRVSMHIWVLVHPPADVCDYISRIDLKIYQLRWFFFSDFNLKFLSNDLNG